MTGHWLYLFIILIIALIVFGPSRLPEIGSGLGRAIREFKHATTEAKEDLRNAVRDEPSAPVAVAAPTADPAAGPYAAPVQESHGA